MLTGYTKLFSSIVASSIWSEEDHTRLVWITMLAMSDQFGQVEASIPGLAKLANVPLPATEKALEKLLSPDPYSRSSAFGGRRIQKVEGGWIILNHAKYREKMTEDERREYLRTKQQERRDRLKSSTRCQQTSTIVAPASTLSTHTDTDTDTDTEESEITIDRIYDAYPRKVGKPKAIAAIIKAIRKIKAAELLRLTINYANCRNGEDHQFTPHPATWYGQERYNDDPSTWTKPISNGKPKPDYAKGF